MKNKKRMGASIIFINSANQILLFLRDDKPGLPFRNCWDVLGGGVEAGETPLDCITREMHEEIGVKLENPDLFNIYDLPDRIESTFWERANFDIGEITLTEGQCLKWFSQGDVSCMADKELAFGFKPIILDFFRQKPFE